MRKQILRIMLSPIIIFVWLIGWALYIVGSKNPRNNYPKSRGDPMKDSLELITIANEELLIATEES